MTSSWAMRSLPGLECFRAVGLTQHYARHSHEQIAIGVFERGVGATEYRGALWRFPVGHIVAMNPDEVHAGQAAGSSMSYRMFYVDDLFFDRPPRFRDVCIRHSAWAKRLLRLHQCLERDDDRLAADVSAVETLGAFAIEFGSTAEVAGGHEPRAVAAIKSYLREHCCRQVSLHELTVLTRLTREHLIRAFRKSVGMPPHAWHLQLRVGHARKLLAAGHSIADTAIAVGFADQSHLTRRFRAVIGVTPARFAAGHFRSIRRPRPTHTLPSCGSSQKSTSRD